MVAAIPGARRASLSGRGDVLEDAAQPAKSHGGIHALPITVDCRLAVTQPRSHARHNCDSVTAVPNPRRRNASAMLTLKIPQSPSQSYASAAAAIRPSRSTASGWKRGMVRPGEEILGQPFGCQVFGPPDLLRVHRWARQVRPA